MKNRDVILALMTALAKHIHFNQHSTRAEWEDLSASSQGTYLELACKEAGLDYDEVVDMMKQEIIRDAGL